MCITGKVHLQFHGDWTRAHSRMTRITHGFTYFHHEINVNTRALTLNLGTDFPQIHTWFWIDIIPNFWAFQSNWKAQIGLSQSFYSWETQIAICSVQTLEHLSTRRPQHSSLAFPRKVSQWLDYCTHSCICLFSHLSDITMYLSPVVLYYPLPSKEVTLAYSSAKYLSTD